MNWRYQIKGSHTHVRVFMNGAKCGDLCFRNEEFQAIMKGVSQGWCAFGGNVTVQFIEESRAYEEVTK